jgi:hypothetical protein
MRATRPPPDVRAAASDATSSDNATSPSRWNGARPPATTTNGSSATASVHSAGNETNSPARSRTYTRSARQLCRRLTNSNSWPAHGWNGCVTRTRGKTLRSAASRAVDESIQRPGRAGQHPDPADHTTRLRLPLPRSRDRTRDAVTRRALPTPTRPVTPPTDPSVGSKSSSVASAEAPPTADGDLRLPLRDEPHYGREADKLPS